MVSYVSKEDRKEYIDHRKVTIAISKYGREGLDNPALDTVLILEPSVQKGWIQQVMGRVLRVKSGKKSPVVIFFEDNVPIIRGICGSVKKTLRRWPHEEGGPYHYNVVSTISEILKKL